MSSRSPLTISWKALLVLEALWMLLKSDVLANGGFDSLQRYMNRASTRNAQPGPTSPIPAIVAAVNRACRYYPKSPACLQRSLALTSMLRRRGIAADLEIGVRQPPFESHAWVEVAGRVINDTPTVRDFYQTIHEFKAAGAVQN
jgi:Transglutaminase-like superfamily